jgi:threonine synthase
MDAKAMVDRIGIGCEPASACSVAGTKKLVEKGIIKPGDTVVGILTGHILKDPEATIGYHADQLENIVPSYRNQMLQADDDIDQIIELLSDRIPT